MSNMPDDIKAIEKRIKSIKAKRQPDTSVERKTKYSDFAIAAHIVTELVAGVLVGAGLGYILDEVFDFQFLFLLIFIIFGGIAGMLNVFRYVKTLDDIQERK
ncbi:MAG: AtpZ/AtpI family protein [Alphaproteobacteria bacterium]|nr:AtpZ/AtpI family protein [Alphaproteobacteria bacterium]